MEDDLMSYAMNDYKKDQNFATEKVEKRKKYINKDLIKTIAVLSSKIKKSVIGKIKGYFISMYYNHNYHTYRK